MRAAIYCRISRDATGEQLGVERQLPPCRELAERRGWTDVEVFTDNDVSAFSGKLRPEYRRMMEEVRAGRIGAVVAWHGDRLHRNLRELLDFMDTVETAGAKVVTVMAGEIDLTNATGQMHAKQMGIYAEYESKRKSERIRLKQLELAEAGKIGGRMRRYGWDGYKVIEAEAEVVQEMARRVLEGDSCRSIATDLTRRRVPTLTVTRAANKGVEHGTSGEWSGAAVRDILERPANAGLRVHRGQVVGKAEWPPILDEDTWRAVVRVFDQRKRGEVAVAPSARKWLLSGVAICGSCGSLMGVTGKSGRYARTVYRCRGKRDPITGQVRHCMTRKAQDLDDWVTAQVVARLSRPDAKDLLTVDDTAAREAAALADVIRFRIAAEEQAYIDDDTIDPASHRRVMKGLHERLTEAENRAVPSPRRPLVEGLIGAEADKRWQALTVKERAKVVESLMSVIVLPIANNVFNQGFNPDYVRIVWHGEPRRT